VGARGACLLSLNLACEHLRLLALELVALGASVARQEMMLVGRSPAESTARVVRIILPGCLTPSRVTSDPSPVRAELDRVGASFRKAGAADYITVTEDEDAVRLVGPPREHPRRYWKGPRWQLLELLAALPDDAGVQAVWRGNGGWARLVEDFVLACLLCNRRHCVVASLECPKDVDADNLTGHRSCLATRHEFVATDAAGLLEHIAGVFESPAFGLDCVENSGVGVIASTDALLIAA
jgi:hypothetical protein